MLTSAAHLFPPRQAYRFRGDYAAGGAVLRPTVGQNPPYGADINYFLQAASGDEPRITIADETGTDRADAARHERGGREPRLVGSAPCAVGGDVRLRTSPIYASWIKVAARRPARLAAAL